MNFKARILNRIYEYASSKGMGNFIHPKVYVSILQACDCLSWDAIFLDPVDLDSNYICLWGFKFFIDTEVPEPNSIIDLNKENVWESKL